MHELYTPLRVRLRRLSTVVCTVERLWLRQTAMGVPTRAADPNTMPSTLVHMQA